MKQQNQVKLLIISCVLILVGLISIQYYLIKNTYDLQKRDYVKEVKDSISVVADAPELDDLQDSLSEIMKNLILQKISKSISESKFKHLLQKKTDSIRDLGNRFLKEQELHYPILKELKLRYQYTEIIFTNDTIRDTILKLTAPPIIYFGKHIESRETFNISFGNYYSNNNWSDDELQGGKKVNYTFSRRHSIDLDISNWEREVLKSMSGMLIAAVGLILAVIMLFFWMYRSLIKQKKIAEVKTDFANNITHELKTPMASLALIIKSLKNEEISNDPQKRNELIASLERQNKRIQNITDRVLESSMNYQTQLVKVDVVPFLKEISSDFKSETHQLKTEINPQEFFVKTDVSQLERVIQNILENAQKYSPDNAEIQLRSYSVNSEYIIEIQDMGIGIPSGEHEKIFDKFYRIPQGNRHNVKGLGLGLFLSKQIMESLGGTIVVRSKTGEGSTFILKIPAA